MEILSAVQTVALAGRFLGDQGEQILNETGFTEDNYPGIWQRPEIVDLVGIHTVEFCRDHGIRFMTPDGDYLTDREIRDAVRACFC